MIELCRDCKFRKLEECKFKSIVETIASSSQLTPEDKHKMIANQRKIARMVDKCPFVNEVNPDYEGKKNL